MSDFVFFWRRRISWVDGEMKGVDRLCPQCGYSTCGCERVVVVTHGGVLRAIYMSVTREPTAGKIMNGSVNVLHLSDKKWAFNSWSDSHCVARSWHKQMGVQAIEYSNHVSHINAVGSSNTVAPAESSPTIYVQGHPYSHPSELID
ncbi:hypothetical protein IFM89_001565 [Coptis chinensis]|uniref:Uncharacterized protein n=1 Tax=Coptis chinensis TaxID=261450 RepID=A0A835HAD5_9MAGN|nr:hypothetical protein IFM89_001565 [Coptis chinensis]